MSGNKLPILLSDSPYFLTLLLWLFLFCFIYLFSRWDITAYLQFLPSSPLQVCLLSTPRRRVIKWQHGKWIQTPPTAFQSQLPQGNHLHPHVFRPFFSFNNLLSLPPSFLLFLFPSLLVFNKHLPRIDPSLKYCMAQKVLICQNMTYKQAQYQCCCFFFFSVLIVLLYYSFKCGWRFMRETSVCLTNNID